MRQALALTLGPLLFFTSSRLEAEMTPGQPNRPQEPQDQAGPPDGTVVKSVLDARQAAEDLLKPEGWHPWEKGFEREGELFFCGNGSDAKARPRPQAVSLSATRWSSGMNAWSCSPSKVRTWPCSIFAERAAPGLPATARALSA